MSNAYYNKQTSGDSNKEPKSQKDWQKKVCEQIIDEWTKGVQYTSSLNEMYEDLYLMMRGKRPGKKYDWQSDITLRKAFQVVWKAITYCSQKVYGAYPIISVRGFDKKGCYQREELLDVWMEEDKYFTVVVQGLLRMLLNGVAIGKKLWRQKLKQMQGPNGQVMSFPIEDRPDDIILNNKDVVVDWMLKPGQSIVEGRFIIHRQVSDLHSLYNSDVEYMNLDMLEPEDAGRTQENADHGRLRQEDGQADIPTSDLYCETETFERQGMWPVKVKKNGDIIPLFEKDEIYDKKTEWRHMIATCANYINPVLIRWRPNPYGEMTYWDGHCYIDAERWQSQGIVEPAKDIMTAQDDNVNAMFDEIWHNLFPPTIVNKFGQIEWDTIKWAPSQVWQQAGNPNENFMFARPSNITTDAWNKHAMLEGEIQTVTPVTNAIKGTGQEKTATVGALNATFSSQQLDFIIKMIEITWLIPSAKMTMRFAQKFAHNLTFIGILGEPFKFDQFFEEYKFKPCASSVRLPEQREREIQEDIQLLQILSSILNPNQAKVINYFVTNILRNRNRQEVIPLFDENYFEPQTQQGQLDRLMGGGMQQGATSNEQGIQMSPTERMARMRRFTPQGMTLQ